MLAYHSYKAGYLPNSGAMFDQHCKFESLMFVVDQAVNHANNVRQERQKDQHTVVYNDGGSSGPKGRGRGK